MDFHVITSTEEQLVMQTSEGGYVLRVLPAPASSLPHRAAPTPQEPRPIESAVMPAPSKQP